MTAESNGFIRTVRSRTQKRTLYKDGLFKPPKNNRTMKKPEIQEFRVPEKLELKGGVFIRGGINSVPE